MKSKTIPKITFVDRDSPIEIFCSKKYKDYYIRGHIIEARDAFTDESVDDWGYAYYHIKAVFLLKSSFFKNTDYSDAYYLQFGIINGKTIREFTKIRNSEISGSVKRLARHIGKTEKELFDESLKEHNPTTNINIKEINIQENPYIINAMKEKREAIVADLDINLDRIEYPKSLNDSTVYPKSTYSLLSYIFSGHDDDRDMEDAASSWLYGLIDILNLTFDYNELNTKKYNSILNSIGKIGRQCIKNKNISNRDIQGINTLFAEIKDKTDPLSKLCLKLLNSLIDDLKSKNLISICQLCGTAFKYSKTKKYCSLKSEGKDCGKKERNRNYYLNNIERIRSKTTKATKKLRAYYKKRGIKK